MTPEEKQELALKRQEYTDTILEELDDPWWDDEELEVPDGQRQS